MLSIDEIKQFITDDLSDERKQYAKIGQRYYEAEHDILKTRMFYFNDSEELIEDVYRSNIKISHPFFTELSDQLASYMLSFEENPIRAKEKVDGLQKHLDQYFGKKFWAEIYELINGSYTKGFEYIYGFKGSKNRMEFQCADSLGVIEVREKDTDDGCKYIIYYYVDRIEKGHKKITRIEVWSEENICYYVMSDNGDVEIDKSKKDNPRPHVIYKDEKTGERLGSPLGYIPFWRMDNNRKRISGLKPIKGIIDDYDLHACSLSNNLKDFDTPIHFVSGFEGDNLDKLQLNLKTKKLVGVGEGGGVEVATVDIPYQARKEKLEIDEKNIYKFGMGLNTSGLKDTNATTNIAIKMAYTLLDLKSDKVQIQLEAVLEELVEVVLAEINQENETDFTLDDVEFKFTRCVTTNETENIANEKVKAETEQIKVNTILNIAANVGDEKTLEAICEVMDWDFEELQSQIEKIKEEQNLLEAKNALNNVVPEDEPIIDEPVIE